MKPVLVRRVRQAMARRRSKRDRWVIHIGNRAAGVFKRLPFGAQSWALLGYAVRMVVLHGERIIPPEWRPAR